jgi:hypothetical protein
MDRGVVLIEYLIDELAGMVASEALIELLETEFFKEIFLFPCLILYLHPDLLFLLVFLCASSHVLELC